MSTKTREQLRRHLRTEGSTVLSHSNSSEREYSKRALNAIIKLWFVGALYGMVYYTIVTAVLLIRSPDAIVGISLSDFFLYIGAPMGGGIVTYLVKSAYEKTRKSYSSFDVYEDLDDFDDMDDPDESDEFSESREFDNVYRDERDSYRGDLDGQSR